MIQDKEQLRKTVVVLVTVLSSTSSTRKTH